MNTTNTTGKFRKRNYKFLVSIPKTMVAPSKDPPLCDGCGDPFPLDERGNYNVNVIILNNSLWGVTCDRCADRIKVPRFTEREVPEEAVQTVLHALGADPVIYFLKR
ncbi:hypothetical protein [Conexivisphaera calida]|uniref:Uncharacterized protein n=1 Tax=Conexivisphaera calida TaxID=1874277 RepID=A0A4V0P1P6_9ARCH|nr:hypothetical protein [Conexivisphaera calida]BBE42450.1 hypothetical protein NAS2_1061 [Conexivisphaera calida]